MRSVKLEVGEFAMFVPLWDVRGRKQRLSARPLAAVTTGHTTINTLRDGLPSGSIAQGADFSGSHHLFHSAESRLDFAPLATRVQV